MSKSVKEITKDALALNEKERTDLVSQLLESFEETSEKGVGQAWLTEIERRMQELDDGKVEAISWDKVRDRLRRMDA